MQVLLSVLTGGFINVIVWGLTTHASDRVQYYCAYTDFKFSLIDKYLFDLDDVPIVLEEHYALSLIQFDKSNPLIILSQIRRVVSDMEADGYLDLSRFSTVYDDGILKERVSYNEFLRRMESHERAFFDCDSQDGAAFFQKENVVRSIDGAMMKMRRCLTHLKCRENEACTYVFTGKGPDSKLKQMVIKFFWKVESVAPDCLKWERKEKGNKTGKRE